MKISDMDMEILVQAIGEATYSVVFAGIGDATLPSELRAMANLNAEIMGRIMAVLRCGDEVGQEIFDMIDLDVARMKASYGQSFGELLGPGGSLSQLNKA